MSRSICTTTATCERQRHERDSGLLWASDPRLALVRQQLTAPDSWLNARETEFVEGQRMAVRNLRKAVRNESQALAALSDVAFKSG